MTQLFLNPLTKFTSDNITALPGARLYFYQNNSSTPKAVYADKAKVTSLGVYVEADSAGIFEPIWLDGTYRASLRYSTNWTTDPVGVVQTGWPIDDVGDIGNFAAFAAWDSTFTYDITTNTFVTGSDGKYYQSIQNPNLNKNPVSNADYWKEVRLTGVWNPNISYVEFDIVEWEGKLYGAKDIVNLNHEPPNSTYWNDLTFNNNVVGDFDVDGDITCDTIEMSNVDDADPLKLDWYQEGSWTPVVSGAVSAGSASYTQQVGKFTKIGNVVLYSVAVAYSGHTGSGVMYISGPSFVPVGTQKDIATISYITLSVGAGLGATAEAGSNGAGGSRFFVASNDPASGIRSVLNVDAECTMYISGFFFTA